MIAARTNSHKPLEARRYSVLRDKGTLIFALCFMAVFAILLKFTFSDIEAGREAIEREQNGLVVSVYLRDLLADLQEGRGYTAMYLGGDLAVLEKITAKHDHLKQDIKNSGVLIGSASVSLRLQRRWEHLSRQILALRIPVPGDSQARSFADYTRVIDEVLGVLHYVGDKSGLVYERDTDANHLVNSVLLPMPILVEYVARMRGLAAGSAARHSLPAIERKEMSELRGSIKAETSRIEEISNGHYEISKNVLGTIQAQLDEALKATRQFSVLIQDELLDKGGTTLTPGVLYGAGSLAMDHYLNFFDRTVTVLETLLQQRMHAQNKRRYAVIIIACVIVLMVLSGLYYYVRNRAVRARAEHDLRETLSSLRLQKYAIDEHAIVSIADRRGIITYVNKKFCSISQYSAEELIGRNHSILNSGYHEKKFFRELWATIARGNVWSGEILNCGKYGNMYWVQSTIVPHLDDAGRVQEYISIRTDITEQKNAEQRRAIRAERLKLRNEQLHGLTLSHFVNTGDERTAFREICRAAAIGLTVPRVGIWLFDEEYGLLERAYQYFETEDKRDVADFLKAVDCPYYLSILRDSRVIAADDAMQDPRLCELAGTYLQALDITSRLDATVRVAGRVMGIVSHEQLDHVRNWNSDEQGFAAAIADMVALVLERQARHRAEAVAHERERRFAGLVENMTDLAWELNVNGCITYCSGSIERILGYRPEEILAKTPFDIMPSEEGLRMKRIFAEHAAEQKPFVNLEHVNLTKDGRLIHMISNGMPLTNDKGGLVGYLCVASDVTARIAVEQERQSAHEAALRASQAKSEFLAMISHEIRTPMNGVMGMLQLMQGTSLDTLQRDLLSTAHESSAMLLNMLNTILDFSKVTTGRLDLDPVEFDPCELVESVTHPLQFVANERGIELGYICTPGMPRIVCGDVLRIRQVLTNLLNNSLKFTEKGVITVSVTTRNTGADEMRLLFVVADTGIGIDPEAQTRIFNAFEQADSSTTRRYGGSGLGLALCKQLVELMDGEISVESSPGHGSRFSFEIPAKSRLEQYRAVTSGGGMLCEADEATIEPPRRRVLVVDDNRVNRRVAGQMLVRLGCDVDEAVGGLDALERLAAERYDLMLLDCQMPDMDGFEVAKHLRASEGAGRHMPIAAMTADAMVGVRQRCLDAGMDDYLSKPIDIHCLEKVLKTHCEATACEMSSIDTDNTGEENQSVNDVLMCVQALQPLVGADYEAMVSGFVSDGDARLDTMHKALLDGDAESLIQAAHSLKGSSGNLGLSMLSKLCDQVLVVVRGNNRDALLKRAVDATANEYERLRDGLRRIGAGGTVDDTEAEVSGLNA